MKELSAPEKYLFEEYKTAVKLTYHIDNLRNNLTKFFLTFGGVAVGGVTIILRGDGGGNLLGGIERVIGILLLIVAITGVLIVGILARLRKSQIEHFRIINNIRKYFLGKDYELWNVVQLSGKTLPKPNRLSGTYMWLLLIIVVNSYILALSIFLVTLRYDSILWPSLNYIVYFAIFIVDIIIQDILYFKLSSTTKNYTYSDHFVPD